MTEFLDLIFANPFSIVNLFCLWMHTCFSPSPQSWVYIHPQFFVFCPHFCRLQYTHRNLWCSRCLPFVWTTYFNNRTICIHSLSTWNRSARLNRWLLSCSWVSGRLRVTFLWIYILFLKFYYVIRLTIRAVTLCLSFLNGIVCIFLVWVVHVVLHLFLFFLSTLTTKMPKNCMWPQNPMNWYPTRFYFGQAVE